MIIDPINAFFAVLAISVLVLLAFISGLIIGAK